MTKKIVGGMVILGVLHLSASESIKSMDDLLKKYSSKNASAVLIDFPEPHLTMKDFSGWSFTNTIFSSPSSGNTNFKGAKLKGAGSLKTIFSKELKNCSFQEATIESVVFEEVISNCDFQKATLKNVEFRKEVAAPVFQAATLTDVDFHDEVKSGNFDQAKLKNVRFRKEFKGSFAGAEAAGCSDKDGKALTVRSGKLELLVPPANEEKKPEEAKK